MSDRMPAEIRLGGTIKRADVQALCSEIEESGVGVEWGENFSPTDGTELFAAAKNGELRLVDDEARGGEFDDLEKFLKEKKIPFDRFTDGKYEYDCEAVHYRPGCKPEITCYITDKSQNQLVQVEEIKKIEKLLLANKVHKALSMIHKLLPKVAPLPPFKIED